MSRYKYDPAKPRCNHKMSEAQFRTFIKNIFRDAHRKWSPPNDCEVASRDGKIVNPRTGRMNIAVKCSVCEGRFLGADVVADHVEPVVGLDMTWEWMMNNMTLMEVANRFFGEPDAYQTLCKDCHYGITQAENEYRRSQK